MKLLRKIKEALDRKNQDRLVRQRTVDWQHYVIVDHILYAEPSAFTSTPQYRPYEEKDFQDVVEHSTRLLDELDLDADGTDVLDMQPGFRALYLKTELAESRILHKWNALHNRSDVLSQLEMRRTHRRELQDHLDKLTEERAALSVGV